MALARSGRKWADADSTDEDEQSLREFLQAEASRFETPADKDGVRTVIEYFERDGKTYKLTKKVKQSIVKNWTNRSIEGRKSLAKFGKPLVNGVGENKLVIKSEEEVKIEPSKRFTTSAVKDDAEDRFYEESLDVVEGLTREKKVWTDMMNRTHQLEREGVRAPQEGVDGKGAGALAAVQGTPAAAPAPSKYLPPAVRYAQKGADGKGCGKDMQQQQEASLRITNLSMDVREGDLQDLFGSIGRLQRVFLAKDMDTGQSRGFAFVTYWNRADAQRAIDKLNGYGYDNLILQVQFAKPRQ